MDYKTRIEASIQEHLDAYMDIVKTLYDNPETGFEEYETQKVLVKYLKDAGFDVKSSVVVDTDFVAEYKSGKDKLFGFFVGQTMKESKGTANPAKVNELLKSRLS